MTYDGVMTEDTPDLYVDGMSVAMSTYDVVIELTRKRPVSDGVDQATRVGVIRMSHEHAKAVAIMLRSSLKAYEQELGATIPVHPSLRSQLTIGANGEW